MTKDAVNDKLTDARRGRRGATVDIDIFDEAVEILDKAEPLDEDDFLPEGVTLYDPETTQAVKMHPAIKPLLDESKRER